MLVNFLRHQFGIRNIDTYLGFYGDLRSTYDLMDDEDLDTQGSVRSICSALHGKIKTREKSLLLLRLMEFCGYKEGHGDDLFKAMVETLEIPEEQFKMFADSTRIKILYDLFQGEKNVTQICNDLEMNQSAVSHQLKILRSSKLIKARRDGKMMLYSLADEHVKTIIAMGMDHVEE